MKLFLFPLLLLGFTLSAKENMVFSCDFSNGFQPQVCRQPCDILPRGVRIVDTENGKALRFGKNADGTISYLTYRLKKSVNPEKLPEDELPFPMRFGRLEFRFRPVDWHLGDPPFNMLLKLEGPLRTTLHMIYTRPHATGIASLQAAYGQYQNPAPEKGRRQVIFPLAELNREKQWHTAQFEWKPDMVTLTIDGHTVSESTNTLSYPRSRFYAEELQLGSPHAALLRGETDIADIRIYCTMPEKKSAGQVERFPELIANRMSAPAVDGVISETEWKNVSHYTGFSQLPGGAVGTHQASVRIGYDDKALYFALRSDGHKRAPVMNKDKRDANLWEDDSFEVFLVPDGKGKEYYQFIVNHRGVVFDQHARSGTSTAECISWNSSGFRAASKITGRSWSMEIAIPFADLGKSAPRAGDIWHFNLCETLQGIASFSLAPVQHGFAEPEKFGILKFGGADAPVIDFSSIGALFRGAAEFRCAVRGVSPVQLEVNAMRYDETAQTEFPLFGETMPVSQEPGIRFRADDDKLGKTGTLYASLTHNGTRIYAGRFHYAASGEAEVETMRRIIVRNRNFLKVSTAHMPAENRRLRFTIQKAAGKTVLEKEVPLTDMKQDTLLPLAGMEEGNYMLFFEILERNGHVVQKSESRPFTVYGAIPPWQGCSLVKADHVPAPWTPLKIAEEAGHVRVSCWNRTYLFGPRSLFAEQITSGGADFLAAPAILEIKNGSEHFPVRDITVKVPEISERRVVVESSGKWGKRGTADVRAEIDYDGFIWYQLTLADPDGVRLDRVSLELKMPYEQSRLLNSGDRGLRNTGGTPEEWSKKLDDTFGPFWIGWEKGGLSFGIESAENWRNQDFGRQAVVRRKDGSAGVSLNFIDRAGSTEKKTLVYGFYLHPTPVRPRPKNFRKLRSDSWFAHNRNLLYRKGYPSNLSWWMSSFTYQGYPEWLTGKKEIAELHKRLVNFGYLMRDYNHYDTLTKEKSRAGWYAAYSSIGRNAPEVIWNGEMWRAGSQDKLYGNTLYGYSMDMIEVCKTQDYSDFYLWRFDRSRKEHPVVDGLYFDLMFWPACTREDHGHGYTDEKGKRRETYAIREHRKWLERLYLYCKEKGDGAPIITHLSGATSRVAGFSYADYFLDGELGRDFLVRDRSYKSLTLDQMRAEILPHIWGPGLIWCSQLYRIMSFVPAGQRKTWKLEPWAERHLAGILLLHDVIPDRTSQNDTAWEVWKALDRFGLSDDDSYLPYWEPCGISGNTDGVNGAVTAFLKKKEKRILLVLFNNLDSERKFELAVDTDLLFGSSGTTDGRDLENETLLFTGKKRFSVNIPKRNFRLIELQLRK